MENFKVKVTHSMTNKEWFVQRDKFMAAATTGLLSGCSGMGAADIAKRALDVAEAAMKETTGK